MHTNKFLSKPSGQVLHITLSGDMSAPGVGNASFYPPPYTFINKQYSPFTLPLSCGAASPARLRHPDARRRDACRPHDFNCAATGNPLQYATHKPQPCGMPVACRSTSAAACGIPFTGCSTSAAICGIPFTGRRVSAAIFGLPPAGPDRYAAALRVAGCREPQGVRRSGKAVSTLNSYYQY